MTSANDKYPTTLLLLCVHLMTPPYFPSTHYRYRLYCFKLLRAQASRNFRKMFSLKMIDIYIFWIICRAHLNSLFQQFSTTPPPSTYFFITVFLYLRQTLYSTETLNQSLHQFPESFTILWSCSLPILNLSVGLKLKCFSLF